MGTYNRLSFLKLAVESIRQEVAEIPHEIVIVDGGSTDGTPRWLTRQKDIITIVQHNRGKWHRKLVERRSWGYFMNLAFRVASGKYVCMLSDDCLLIPGAIKNGYRLFEDKISRSVPLGALAFFWRDWPEEKSYRVGLTLGGKIYVNHGMYLRRALEAVGYVDEERYSFYHADGDLCLKIWQAGYCCESSPDSYVEHYSHANRAARKSNLAGQQADWKAYIERWEGTFYDPRSSDTGGWIQKSYVDTYETARRIRVLHLRNILKRIISVVTDFRSIGQRARKLHFLIRHGQAKKRA